jgi:hypothetical protein
MTSALDEQVLASQAMSTLAMSSCPPLATVSFEPIEHRQGSRTTSGSEPREKLAEDATHLVARSDLPPPRVLPMGPQCWSLDYLPGSDHRCEPLDDILVGRLQEQRNMRLVRSADAAFAFEQTRRPSDLCSAIRHSGLLQLRAAST